MIETPIHEQLAEKQRQLEQLEAEYKDFAYAVSHDLSAPLRAIEGFSSFIAEDHAQDFDDRSQRHLEHVIDGSQKARHILAALLDFSRINTRAEAFSEVNCDALLAEVQDQEDLAEWIDLSGAQIEIAPLPTIFAARQQIAKVIAETLRNALTYHAEGETPNIVIKATQTEQEWIFSVIDNGIGINDKAKERVFNVLKRGVKERDYPGSGMGLSIARKILHRHKGDIWITSSSPGGTTFCFSVRKGLQNAS